MTVSRARRGLKWSTLGCVTGALLVTGAAADPAPAAGTAGRPARTAPAGSPAADTVAGTGTVAVQVGRMLDGSGPGCRPGSLLTKECGGWQLETVRATPGGALDVAPEHLAALAPGATAGPLTRPGGPLRLSVAAPARLTDVTVHDTHGRRIAGTLGAGGGVWRSTDPLRADESYAVQVRAQGPAAAAGTAFVFRTAPARERTEERLTADLGPRSGTYGAGQIVTAELSAPVPRRDRRARALVEQALEVVSEPRVSGSWYWVDDQTLHYRPRGYWPAHTVIEVRSGLDGVALGGGRYGGPSAPVHLVVGDRIEAVTDSARHRMTVRRNGLLLRELPVTTGKAGFRTRSGIKVVLKKEAKVRMRGDSVGIKRGTREFYDMPVYWATRVTWSGEYVHAAPWSVEAQGEENVSHGCTGMSTEDAQWFFETVHEGDLVSVVNSGGQAMTPFDNGFGDWNLGWPAWLAGSALPGAPDDGPAPGVEAPAPSAPDAPEDAADELPQPPTALHPLI
ncbi:Ig-like domain-containing protein [Streptomyces sp. NPDC089919]|uniref:L,D-transpeptidase n=1 Tax=Streptomyces sp. NPDC089919 TaxID=3155188 RepID=UPI0034380E8B